MSLNINMEFNEKENIWIVEPEGELDIYTSPEFNEKLVSALNNKKTDIVIDGSKLDYLDSTGLGALISIFKLLKEDGNKVYIKNVKPNIKKLFYITELDKVFIIEE
ncbi:MAG: STAS domain-containing protein [Tissierellia bacterium]|nr:STAS domain-containing protein [Tissierellia bacterium]